MVRGSLKFEQFHNLFLTVKASILVGFQAHKCCHKLLLLFPAKIGARFKTSSVCKFAACVNTPYAPLGSRCGTVGRAVASCTKGLRYKTSHKASLYSPSTVLLRRK